MNQGSLFAVVTRLWIDSQQTSVQLPTGPKISNLFLKCQHLYWVPPSLNG